MLVAYPVNHVFILSHDQFQRASEVQLLMLRWQPVSRKQKDAGKTV
jgi:hypothetical protein